MIILRNISEKKVVLKVKIFVNKTSKIVKLLAFFPFSVVLSPWLVHQCLGNLENPLKCPIINFEGICI